MILVEWVSFRLVKNRFEFAKKKNTQNSQNYQNKHISQFNLVVIQPKWQHFVSLSTLVFGLTKVFSCIDCWTFKIFLVHTHQTQQQKLFSQFQWQTISKYFCRKLFCLHGIVLCMLVIYAEQSTCVHATDHFNTMENVIYRWYTFVGHFGYANEIKRNKLPTKLFASRKLFNDGFFVCTF